MFVQVRQTRQGRLFAHLAISPSWVRRAILSDDLFERVLAGAELNQLGRLFRQLNDLDRVAPAPHRRDPAALVCSFSFVPLLSVSE